MSDRMPEYMSDKMPERLADRIYVRQDARQKIENKRVDVR